MTCSQPGQELFFIFSSDTLGLPELGIAHPQLDLRKCSQAGFMSDLWATTAFTMLTILYP